MQRILFILHYPPPVHGSSVVGQYIKESPLINETFNCRYINLGTSKNINEIGKGYLRKLGLYISIVWKVLLKLLRFKPQFCYLAITVKGTAFYKDAIIAVLIKTFGVKLAYHFHNKGIKQRQDKFPDNILYRIVFKNSEIILLSKYLYPDVQKYVAEKRVHYCPNGIPDTKVKDLKANFSFYRDNRNRSGTPQILFLSNLIESKGVFILLEACKILHDKQLPFHCIFVGDEGDINKNQFQLKKTSLGVNQCVHFLGRKYGKQKEEIFNDSDIFVHPSYNDCFPLVLLEAMQHSLPVISTYEGGIADIVENKKTGFLVPPKNVHALAEKLEILLNNPHLCKQMGNAGFNKFKNEFTLNTFENRLREILYNITSKQPIKA